MKRQAPSTEVRPELLGTSSSDSERSETNLGATEGPMCEVCENVLRRYCCPACGILTCSLSCCTAHKNKTGCTGRRDRTVYKPIGKFTEQDLRSDYHFLEDVGGGLGRAKRHRSRDVAEGKKWTKAQPAPRMAVVEDRADSAGSGPDRQAPSAPPGHVLMLGFEASREKKPGAQNKLVKAAAQHGVTLLLMPQGMSRRVTNTSYADKRMLLYWRVEFMFPVPEYGSLVTGQEGRLSKSLPVLQATMPHVVVERAASERTWKTLLEPRLGTASNGKGDAILRHVLRRHAEAFAKLGGEERESEQIPNAQTTSAFKLFLRKEPGAANNPLYYELDPRVSIGKSLKGKTVIEFPTVYFVLPLDYSKYSIVPALIEEVAEMTDEVS